MLPSLLSLTVLAPVCEISALSSLGNALDFIEIYGGASITQLDVVFSISLDLSLAGGVDDDLFPKCHLLGISELEVAFRDGFQSEASMASIQCLSDLVCSATSFVCWASSLLLLNLRYAPLLLVERWVLSSPCHFWNPVLN